MTNAEIAAARALVEAATPGPWDVYQDLPMDAMQVNHPAGDICELDTWQHRPDEREPDAAFIAASRSLVPKLLDEVERLRAKLKPTRTMGRNVNDDLNELALLTGEGDE